jgi:Tfp pilus assembly protein PilN
MDEHEINLLPMHRQKSLALEYRVRVGTVIALAITGLFVSATLLLLPAYVFLSKAEGAKQEQLGSIESALSVSNEPELAARLKRLVDDALELRSLKDGTPAVHTIRSLLAVPRGGVTLSSFVYTPAVGKAPQSISVSGISLTRDALRKYQLALEKVESVASAELPVSAYAKDANIPFVITVVFSP